MNVERLREMGAWPKLMEWTETQSSIQEVWRSCPRGDWLLWLLEKLRYDENQLRLIACRIIREQCWHLMADERSRHCVEVAEAYVRGEATEEELRAAWDAAGAAVRAALDAAGAAAWAAADVAWAAADAAGAVAGAAAAADAAGAPLAAVVVAAVAAGSGQAGEARTSAFRRQAEIVRAMVSEKWIVKAWEELEC